MLIVTTDNIPGKEIKNVIGLVKGSTIRTKHVGKDITASFKHMVGGELKEYQSLLQEARQIAIGRMAEEAESLGANAIVAVRLASASIMSGAAEMVAYGTAVVID